MISNISISGNLKRRFETLVNRTIRCITQFIIPPIWRPLAQSYGEEKLAAPQASPLSGEQEKHGLLFEWPRRKRSPFPCERTVPFDNDMKRFLCHPTPSTTPGRLLIRWPQRVGLGRISRGAYGCIRFYRSPVGSEEPLAESSQASLWETGRSHPCPHAPVCSREVLDALAVHTVVLRAGGKGSTFVDPDAPVFQG